MAKVVFGKGPLVILPNATERIPIAIKQTFECCNLNEQALQAVADELIAICETAFRWNPPRIDRSLQELVGAEFLVLVDEVEWPRTQLVEVETVIAKLQEVEKACETLLTLLAKPARAKAGSNSDTIISGTDGKRALEEAIHGDVLGRLFNVEQYFLKGLGVETANPQTEMLRLLPPKLLELKAAAAQAIKDMDSNYDPREGRRENVWVQPYYNLLVDICIFHDKKPTLWKHKRKGTFSGSLFLLGKNMQVLLPQFLHVDDEALFKRLERARSRESSSKGKTLSST